MVIPGIIENYFKAKNAKNISAIVDCFDAHATVHDEGKSINGISSIRSWVENSTKKYNPQFRLLDADAKGSSTSVTAEVSGSFEGSPLKMRFNFEVSSNKIQSLKSEVL